MDTRISSAAREVVIGPGLPTVIIGERINPAGKKRLAEELKAGNLEGVRREAAGQVEAGADVIDICVSTFGVEEKILLPRAVEAAMEAVEAPLCLDSPRPEALEAALKIYPGKALVNSVSGEERKLARVLPLVKEHQAAVIGLLQDDEGIPRGSEKRLAIAGKIVERAEKIGIPREDIILDCLATAVGADPKSGSVTLETIHKIGTELGVNITLGASNISFGLPDRTLLNGAFAAICIAFGATCLIADAARIKPMVRSADLLAGKDHRARRYIEDYRRQRVD